MGTMRIACVCWGQQIEEVDGSLRLEESERSGILSNEQKQGDAVFEDILFRQKRKKGQYREVEAPHLETVVADTHAHLQMLPNPGLALARCAMHNIGFVCTIVDPVDDGETTFSRLNTWKMEATRSVMRFTSWC